LTRLSKERPLNEEGMTRLEHAIGVVLRSGVIVSSLCLAVGLALSLAGAAPAAAPPLLQVGIIVLLCTPVARVVVSTVEYISDRDWPFASLTTIVLLELLASAVAALAFNRRI
jgi:uncharacterized membrane protein